MLLKDIVNNQAEVVLRLAVATGRGKELGGVDVRLQFREIKTAGFLEISAVNPGMEGRVRRVMMWIVADPAVMVNGRVERLRGITDVMSHHAHDVEDVLLGVGDFTGRAVLLISLQAGKTRF